MRFNKFRYVYRFTLAVFLAVVAVVQLYLTHRSAYRRGVWVAGRPVTLAYIREDEDCDGLHLYYSVLALRVYARYPDTGSASERIGICASAEMQVKMVEKRVIPRLRAERRTEEADQLAQRVREARTLLAAVEKKQKR